MLNEKINVGKFIAANRVVIQPMEGCDCHEDGSPSEFTEKKYIQFAKSGAGIIWFEANAVCPEGCTNIRQMRLTDENLPKFKALTEKIRETAMREVGYTPLLFLQLTHSGRQSIHPMIAYRNPVYEETRPATDAQIVTDEYLAALSAQFAHSAQLAETAGFDGVDVKCCHGYLMAELLSAYSRPGNYGGSFENRTRCFLDCVRAVKRAVSEDFIVVTRLGVSDMVPKPYGFGTTETGELDLTESKQLIGKLIECGIEILNITLGNPYYNPHVNRPFRVGAYKAPERPEVGMKRFYNVEKEIKAAFPQLKIVASGISYYRETLMQEAESMLRDNVCDFVGFGRSSLAYPSFYKDYLEKKFDAKKCCVACSKCTFLMRAKSISGCATFNEYYKKLYKDLGL